MIVERIGPYKIIDRVGAGGMGEVFKGQHDETGQIVAIKLISSTEADDSQLIKRFRREIVSASRLSHDNIVRVYDSGEQGEHVWYAMEYIDGSSLSEMMASGEPFETPKALSIAKDLCKAFVYMHSRGFIHRDIKPGNIMVSREGIAKLVDFGLVKSKFATNITVTGVVIGTPAFMSPEMLQGRDVDHRSDIFQLGQVLYKMLTGRGAFEGANSFEIATACVTGAPRPLTAIRPSISPSLEAVVLHCLDKNPEDRYGSAADILNDLKRAELGLKPMGASLRKPAAQHAAPQASVPTMPMELPPKAGPAPWAIATGVALFLGLAAWGVHLFLEARASAAYDFRNLRIEAGLKKARVRWESESPYPSRLLYAAVTGQESAKLGFDGGTEVVSGTESDPLHHSLELRSLTPDTSYQLAVVYPDRRLSLPQSFHTQRSGLRSHAFTFGPGAVPVLAVSTHFPARVQFRWNPGQESRSTTLSTSHTAVLTGADPLGEGTIQIACTNTMDEQWTPSPVPLPDVRGLARELNRSVDAVQARVLNLLATLDRAEHHRKLEPALVKDALPRPVIDSIARFTPVGPAYFGSRRVTLEEKAALYRPLSILRALDCFCAQRKLPFDSGAVRVLGPEFGPLLAPALPKEGIQKYSDATKLMAAGLSANQADIVATFSKASRSLKVPFQLEDVAKIKRAELTVHGIWEAGLGFEELVQAKVNGGLDLNLYRDPTTSAKEKHIHFVHGFDPRALTDGTNEIVLTLHPLPGLRSSTELLVVEVALRVAR